MRKKEEEEGSEESDEDEEPGPPPPTEPDPAQVESEPRQVAETAKIVIHEED